MPNRSAGRAPTIKKIGHIGHRETRGPRLKSQYNNIYIVNKMFNSSKNKKENDLNNLFCKTNYYPKYYILDKNILKSVKINIRREMLSNNKSFD